MEGYVPLSANRNGVRDRVIRHPLVTFILLAFAISSFAWFLAYRFDLGVANGFGVIGSTGPALAAMIVSALVKTEPSGVPAGKRWRLFAVVSFLVLGLFVIRRLWVTPQWLTVADDTAATTAYPTPEAFLVDVLAAAVVAFILSGVLAPRQGVRELLQSLDLRRRPIRWYWWAVAAGLYPAIVLFGNAVSGLLGQPAPTPASSGPWYLLGLDVLLTSAYILVGGGGLEEPGWRGFALPHLQKRFGPLRSSLILGVIWTFWHWPLFWLDPSMGGPFGVFFYMLTVVPLTFLFTAVFNRTAGSLPIAILLHTSINVAPIFLPESSLASGLWLLLTVATAVWLWRSGRQGFRK
jgi:membrane protease YdiL (CAAX protease family)